MDSASRADGRHPYVRCPLHPHRPNYTQYLKAHSVLRHKTETLALCIIIIGAEKKVVLAECTVEGSALNYKCVF